MTSGRPLPPRAAAVSAAAAQTDRTSCDLQHAPPAASAAMPTGCAATTDAKRRAPASGQTRSTAVHSRRCQRKQQPPLPCRPTAEWVGLHAPGPGWRRRCARRGLPPATWSPPWQPRAWQPGGASCAARLPPPAAGQPFAGCAPCCGAAASAAPACGASGWPAPAHVSSAASHALYLRAADPAPGRTAFAGAPGLAAAMKAAPEQPPQAPAAPAQLRSGRRHMLPAPVLAVLHLPPGPPPRAEAAAQHLP